MKRLLLPGFLLSLAACSPPTPVATQPSTPSNSTEPSSQILPVPDQSATSSPSATGNSPDAEPPAAVVYSGTAYQKGLSLREDDSYEEKISFQGSAELFPDDQLKLNLSNECGESPRPFQTAEIIIQLNPETKTWKQLSHEFEDCNGYQGDLDENEDEQYQPYTIEDLGTQSRFNLGTNDPDGGYDFRDFYGVTINKQGSSKN